MPTAPSLEWRSQARADLMAIVAYIAENNPNAAQALKGEIETKVAALPRHPNLYKPGRIKNTREMVVRPNYIVVYRENGKTVSVLRVLHAAQQWPPSRR
jgi:addiction module RelE/StbE family toxin